MQISQDQFYVKPLPERPASCQGWIEHQSLKVKHVKGVTAFLSQWLRISEVESTDILTEWRGRKENSYAKCLKMSLLIQHRGTTNNGLGWGKLILTPF